MKNRSIKRCRRICSLLFAFTMMFSFAVHASPLPTGSTQEELDHYIQSTLTGLGVPGASVAISHRGELIYSQTFGASIEKDTRFYIGSISKSFTALAIAQLAEQGKVDLDERVSTYIEEFAVSDSITVRHLVHHVSGMTEEGYSSWGALPADAEFSDLVEDMGTMPLTYSPGTQFAYFNPNYSLLGYIIEIASGQSYVEYVEEHVLRPMGLAHTSLTGEVDTKGHLSFFGFSKKREEQYVKYDLPAGYMTSTAEDLVRFLDAVQQKDQRAGLSPEGFERLVRTYPPDNFYSMGWMNYALAERPAIHHGGSLPGFSSNAVMLPEDEFSIAILLNKNHLLSAYVFYPDLTDGIIGILTGQDAPTRFKVYWMYRALSILFALTLLANGRKFIQLLRKPPAKTTKARTGAVLINIAIAAGLFLVVPLGGQAVFAQGGMKWSMVVLLLPDLISWLMVGIAVHVITAGIHLALLVKNKRHHSTMK